MPTQGQIPTYASDPGSMAPKSKEEQRWDDKGAVQVTS